MTVSNGASGSDVVLYASEAPVRAGSWRVVTDASAAGGRRLEHPQAGAGAATIDPPLANPADFVEFAVSVMPDTNYRLWLRLKGASNSGYSDSVWVQTSDTVDTGGAAVYRIGTASATRVNLQDCSGCTISGWGWQDNGYGTGVLGPALRFATGGVHESIRIQAREDGVSIDQVGAVARDLPHERARRVEERHDYPPEVARDTSALETTCGLDVRKPSARKIENRHDRRRTRDRAAGDPIAAPAGIDTNGAVANRLPLALPSRMNHTSSAIA